MITIHRVGTTPVTKLPYIVMEYIDGETLSDRLKRRGRLAGREAAELARQRALGLHAAHTHGVFHRDIKPSNILVAHSSGRVKVSDFGLAVVPVASGSAKLPSERIAGTAPYLSPEQFVTPNAADQRSDVYALGVVLYELLTGERPFRGTDFALCLQIIHDEPPLLRKLHPDVDRDLETICLKCLDKKPSARYGKAQALAEDLERFLHGEPIQARPPGPIERGVRWARRNTWKAAAAISGLAAVLVIVVLATVAAERERDLRSQAEGLARDEQASRIRAEGLARREEEHRRRAEQLLRLAEARQAALQYQAANRALDEQDFGSASKALSGFPRSQRRLETRLLERRLQARPQTRATLIDDYWGIIAAAAAPDAKRLVTSYATGTVLVWELTTGRITARLCEGRWSEELRRRLHYFEDRPQESKMADWGPCYTALTWLAGTECVAAVSLDGTVVLFDLKTNSVKTIKRVGEPLYAIASSTDGSQVVCGGSSGKLYAATLASETETPPVEGESAVAAILAIPDSRQYLIGRADGRLELLSAEGLSSHAKWTAPGSIWGWMRKH